MSEIVHVYMDSPKRKRSPNGSPKPKRSKIMHAAPDEVREEVRECAIEIARNVERQKHGLQPKYHPTFDRYVEKMTIVGGGMMQIADALGCSHSALEDWVKKYPSLGAAIKRGRERADAEIEDALNRRAKGYDRVDNVIINGKEVTLVKHYPPDPTSMIFWLKNRQPGRWREKTDVNMELDYGEKLRATLAAAHGATRGEAPPAIEHTDDE